MRAKMSIEEQITNILDWMKEWQDELKVDKYDDGNSYTVRLGKQNEHMMVTVVRSTLVLWFHEYNITFLNDMCSESYFMNNSMLVKKIFKFAEELYNRKSNTTSIFEDEIWKLIEYEPKDDEFSFGEPRHTENLPNCPLEVGKTYLVPLKLVGKERRFDGGRGSEYYVFNYQTEDYGYTPFSVIDYRMSKEIRPFEKSLDKEE